MRRKVAGLVLAGMLLAGGMMAQQRKQAEIDLQVAIRTEAVNGDLKGAIKQYEAIVAKHGKDRTVAATALIHMAECYQKMGDTESRKIYERVLRDYADQKEAVTVARARLGGGSESKNAGVMTRRVWTGRGVDGSGSPSPDGRYLSFIYWETGDLAIRDLSTGANRMLTNTGGWDASGDYPFRSVISHDGRQVAYGWFVQNDRKNELRVLPLAGAAGELAKARVLHRSEANRDYVEPYGWSPDGKQLLVIRNLPDRTSQIAMLSTVDGSIRAIKSLTWQQPNPRLSPDGKFIAYDGPAGGKAPQRDIFVLAVDGSRETAVVQSPSEDRDPVWSPDGSRLLFLSLRTSNQSLWSVRIEAGKPAGPAELVKADIGPMQPLGITPKGSLFYSLAGRQNRNVYIADLNQEMKAAKPPVLATDRFINSNVGPAWSPDGQSLAWYSFNNPAPGSVTLVVRSEKTGEERGTLLRVPVRSPFNAGPMWFPDGRSVLVNSANRQQQFQFYRVDSITGDSELLHTPTVQRLSSYRLSPDGKTIFYCAPSDGVTDEELSGSIIRFDIGSGSAVELKKDGWFISIALSPDGKQLAYLESQRRPGFATSISVMPATGGEAREVFHRSNWGDRYNTMNWSPDQRHLLFVNAGVEPEAPNVLWRVPVAGGAAEKMGISMSARIKSPTIHPDGRRIAFGAADADSGEIWTMENFLPTLNASK